MMQSIKRLQHHHQHLTCSHKPDLYIARSEERGANREYRVEARGCCQALKGDDYLPPLRTEPSAFSIIPSVLPALQPTTYILQHLHRHQYIVIELWTLYDVGSRVSAGLAGWLVGWLAASSSDCWMTKGTKGWCWNGFYLNVSCSVSCLLTLTLILTLTLTLTLTTFQLSSIQFSSAICDLFVLLNFHHHHHTRYHYHTNSNTFSLSFNILVLESSPDISSENTERQRDAERDWMSVDGTCNL